MKKLITYICIFYATVIFAQDPLVTGTPSNYTVIDENVTLTFDVTNATDNGGNPLVGKDLYIWAFSDAGDSKANGDWTNIKAAARLNKVSDTEYTLKFPITDGTETYNTFAELFGVEAAPGSITSIGYLLRDQAPTFQTGDLTIPFSPFKFDAAEVRTFPSSATTKDVLLLRFNKSFTSLSNPALTGAENISIHIEPVGNAASSVDLKTTKNGRYFETGIIPSIQFEAISNAGNLKELKYYFFDTDNPSIKSTEGSIILKKAGI